MLFSRILLLLPVVRALVVSPNTPVSPVATPPNATSHTAPETMFPAKQKGLRMDFDVLHGDSMEDASVHKKARIAKRSSDSPVLKLWNSQTYYSAVLYIGSNKEKCRVLVDTGSSDLWVMGRDVSCEKKTMKKRAEGETYVDSPRIHNSHIKNTSSSRHRLKDFEEPKEFKEVKDSKYTTKDSKFGSEEGKKGSKKGFKEKKKGTQGKKGKGYYFKDVKDFKPKHSLEKEYGNDVYLKNSLSKKPAYKTSPCHVLGTFDSANSLTFRRNKKFPDFSLSYYEGVSASGIWGRDTVGFSNSNNILLSFGVANRSSSIEGVLGIGSVFEEMTSFLSGHGYPNFPMQIKKSGLINKVVYSLYLNRGTSPSGSILFGAVDHKKYQGRLQTVPVLDAAMTIRLNGIYLELSNGKISEVQVISTEPMGAMLDSGTTYQHLPKKVVKQMVKLMRGKYSKREGFYRVDCSYKNSKGNLVYDFSGIKIRVPVSELLYRHRGFCYLGVEPYEDNQNKLPRAILGNTFLRSAYVVYDYESMEISMAQARYTNEEDVEMVTDTIPRAKKAARYKTSGFQKFLRLYSHRLLSGPHFDSQ